jgi:filamentous hemagglutinin family protein
MLSDSLYPKLVAIGVFSSLGLIVPVATAQIIPDATLGAESSRLTPNVVIQGGNADRIDGGAQRGGNLFHSFSQFNVANGQALYFNNPAGVQNILSRVTGGTSNILGTLGVDGSANLYLFNPNGIVFGPNAQLKVGGSFVGSTAIGVQFGDQGSFTVNQSDAPPLLTIQPSALAFTPQSTGSIVSSSVAAAGTSPSGRNLFGLQVPNGQSLILAGGNIRIDGGGMNGGLNAQGGRIELGGLVGSGTIGLDSSSGQPKLVFPDAGIRSNVSLVNNARVSVRGVGGGDAVVNANIFTAEGGGRIIAGTENIRDAGEIILNANVINLSGESSGGNPSGLYNQVSDVATGRGGLISVNTNELIMTSGAGIDTTTFGPGSSGDIRIKVRDFIKMDGATSVENSGNLTSISSYIQNDVNSATVQGGKVQVNTDNLTLLNGAQIANNVFGNGNAGEILINARIITLQGKARDFASGFKSVINSGAVGNAGEILVQTSSLNVADGASISSFTRGRGNAGKIVIEARESVLLTNSINAIDASVERQGVGQGGTIQIRTPALTLANGSSITNYMNGQGNAGDILVDTNSLIIERLPGAVSGLSVLGAISANTTGLGNAGKIVINARDRIALDNGLISSDVLSGGTKNPELRGEGRGEEIRITTELLQLKNGSLISTSSTGKGDAGAISIAAGDTVSVGSGSRIFSNLTRIFGSSAIGNAGSIQIQTGKLLVDSGVIGSSTSGQGNAGNIRVQARDQVVLNGSEGFTSIGTTVFSGAVGQGGNIDITAPSLLVTNGGTILAGTLGQGGSGNITLQISDRLFLNGAVVFAGSGGFNQETNKIEKSIIPNRAGTVTINNPRLIEVRNGSLISLSSTSAEKSGDFNINGGRFIIDRSSITAEADSSDGGNINFQLTDPLVMRHGSKISTTSGTAQAGGNGGIIQISTPAIVAVAKENSDITANAFSGSGGTVNIQTNGLFGIAPRPKLTPLSDITASSDQGVQGTIAITQPDIRPEQGLTELPGNILDSSNQINQSCPNARNGRKVGQFVVSGRGSLPISPLDPLADNPNLPELAQLTQADRPIANTPAPVVGQIATAPTIVEAQGWQKNPDGKVILLAQPIVTPPTATPSLMANAPNAFACVTTHPK